MQKAPDMKTLESRKQVVTRFYFANLTEAKTAAEAKDPQFTKQEDIQFPVGRIVCKYILYAPDPTADINSGISFVTSDLFDGQTIGFFGENNQLYNSTSDDYKNGMSHTKSEAEIVYAEPKKIKGTYAFHAYYGVGVPEYTRGGQIVIMMKFYEY